MAFVEIFVLFRIYGLDFFFFFSLGRNHVLKGEHRRWTKGMEFLQEGRNGMVSRDESRNSSFFPSFLMMFNKAEKKIMSL